MKNLIMVILVSMFSTSVFGQDIEFGKYRLCYDMYWKCHFQNLIELKSDSSYEFIYLDDTQMKTTYGKWEVDSNYVVLTPDHIPDEVQVREVFETSTKKSKSNLVRIRDGFNGIPGLRVTCYRNGNSSTYITDSIGEFEYQGKVTDSLLFSIKGRKLTVIPEKRKTPSIIRITVDSNHEDLIYQQLGDNKILIQNGRMMVEYRDSENGELKTEYFEKVN